MKLGQCFDDLFSIKVPAWNVASLQDLCPRRRLALASDKVDGWIVAIEFMLDGEDSIDSLQCLAAEAKVSSIDPQAWLANVLKRIAEHPVQRLDELLPWSWKAERLKNAA